MKKLQQLVPVLSIVLSLSAQAQNSAPQATSRLASVVSRTAVSTNGADMDASKTLHFTGTVVDAAGQPVAGATVESYQYGGNVWLMPGELELKQQITAGRNGTFELNLSPDATIVIVKKSGFAPAWQQLYAARNEEARFVLTPPTTLGGVVVDETDKPVANAEVSVITAISENESENGWRNFGYLSGKPARDYFNARTTADGKFLIKGFPTNASADLAVRIPGKVLRQPTRQYIGPDTMQCRAGQQDIKLTVEPSGSVEGKVVVPEGKPVKNVRLQLTGDQPGSFRSLDPVSADEKGVFRFADVAAGSYQVHAVFGTNAVPDWVADPVPVSVESGKATRDVQVTAIRGGMLEVVVSGKDDHKPAAKINVNAYKESFQASGTSDSNGVALLRLPPGDYQVSAVRRFAQADQASVTMVADKTNRVEMEVGSPRKVTGVVHQPNGQPAAGLPVRIIGGYMADDLLNVKSDANGHFETEWEPRQFGGAINATFCLLIRDAEHNLAVAQELDEDTGALDLKLEPGLTLAGRVECDGKPITNFTAGVMFWIGNRGMTLNGLNRATNTPGRFEIPALPLGRKYGVVVSAKGYGQKFNNDVEAGAEAQTLELDPMELKVANLPLAGQVLDNDDKPVAGIYVSLNGENQPNGNTRTDRDGRFAFDKVCEGNVRLFANNSRGAFGNVTAEGGDTNVVLHLGQTSNGNPGSTARKLKGIVTGPDGQPVSGAQVTVFPNNPTRWVKTTTNGAYNFNWTIEPWQQSASPLLVIRDLVHNLAATEDVLEEVTNLNVQLKPALTVTGRVEGTNDAPLARAEVGVWLRAGNSYNQLDDRLADTDAQGRFEIKGLPVEAHYIIFAKTTGYGRSQQELVPEAETNRMELPPFILKPAIFVIAGQVVNQDEKPVSGVNVSLNGDGQPDGFMTTDGKGRFNFKVCEGQVRLFANSQSGFGQASVEAGDTNIVIQLTENGMPRLEAPKRPALTGKPLPDLAMFGVSADAVPAGKPLLLCLLDVEQRPSRRLARLMSEQNDALKQKGIVVAAIQATVTTDESFNEWKNANPPPYPVGRLVKKSSEAKWVTGVESLPWLILTDKEHRVAAEGFALDELDAKLNALAK
jgi:protocatechuate 3,4-dioxygenase beta subunit